MVGNNVVPDDYAVVLADAKKAIEKARIKAALAVNSELIELYWNLGNILSERVESYSWGSKVIQKFSNDLRAEFPNMTGLSLRNLQYMRSFAEVWSGKPITQQVAAQLPWGHNQLLLDKFRDDTDKREWYAKQAVEFGWSRAVLEHQIKSQLHSRSGSALSNFDEKLPTEDSDLMQEITKDPYHLEFLGLKGDIAERELEQALIDHIERFLR